MVWEYSIDMLSVRGASFVGSQEVSSTVGAQWIDGDSKKNAGVSSSGIHLSGYR
jgi:hypothetical protein